MIDLLKKVLVLLDFKQKINLIFITLLTFLVSILETVGIGIIAVFVSILGDVSSALNKAPSIIQSFFQDYKDIDVIIFSLIFIIIFFIFKNFIVWIFIYFMSKQRLKVHLFIVEKLLNKYLNQKYSFFIENNKSKIINNLKEETSRFCSFLFSLFNVMKEIALFVFLCAGIVFINFNTSIIIIIGMVIFSYLLFKSLKKRLKKLGQDQTYFTNYLFKYLIETFDGIRLIKIRSLENIFFKNVKDNFKGRFITLFKQNIIGPIPRLLLEVIAVTGLCATILVYIFNGSDIITILPIITFLTLSVVRMIPAVAALNGSVNSLVVEANAVNIIFNELNKEIDPNFKEKNFDNFNEQIIEENNFLEIKNIELEKVSYSYPGNNLSALKDINIRLDRNEILGILGKSGSGKSTLSDILTGLLKPSSGKVFINGSTKDDLSLLQSKIGYVPQNNFILDNDLRYNITLSKNNIDEEKLSKAINLSELQSSKELKERRLGDDGLNISGGQKQRIGLARVFYQNSKLIILDEATSSIDMDTEEKIMKNLYNIKKDKIIIIIAHRLSTLSICDKLLILNNGKIADYGKKEEIINRNRHLEKYIKKNSFSETIEN
ncbi:ABC transporter ATP-binding protein/permease [Candidatus Pelagibacter sp.]|nr:ABC transporter ATP-binding protein/permease [Candidatus Pelagibacter sp.]